MYICRDRTRERRQLDGSAFERRSSNITASSVLSACADVIEALQSGEVTARVSCRY
jgi:hypothetical protein